MRRRADASLPVKTLSTPSIAAAAHRRRKRILAVAGDFAPVRHKAFLLQMGLVTVFADIGFAGVHGLPFKPCGGGTLLRSWAQAEAEQSRLARKRQAIFMTG